VKEDIMDKVDTTLTHAVTLGERSNLVISGVKKIESFDNEEFLMQTSMGYLMIKGEGLEIVRLDTYQGNVNIKGKVNGLSYIEDLKGKDKEDGVFNRLFK
jgi:sporulation protein YabP